MFRIYKKDLYDTFFLLLFLLVVLGCSNELEEQAHKQEVKIEIPFRLSDFGQFTIPMDSQGMDIFEDTYLFQASYAPKKECCGIVTVDLLKRHLLGEFTFYDEFPIIHMNNVNCGERYDKTDKFPLLYISEALGEQRCFIVRLNNDASHYSVVQTIKYNGDMYARANYQDWFLDNDKNYIYAYGRMNTYSGEYFCLKFLLPQYAIKKVVFTDSDIVDAFTINTGLLIPQGTKCNNNILYALYGYNTNDYPSWYVKYDLNAKKIILKEKLDPCIGEPEAVSIFRDKVLVSNNATNPLYWMIKD